MGIEILWQVKGQEKQLGSIDLAASIAKLESMLRAAAPEGTTQVIMKLSPDFELSNSIPGKEAVLSNEVSRIVDAREWIVRLPEEA